ncbi:TetR/AcrR family transcriptional regulator C-terminal domain-containing protein [Zavarzinia sp. CC-PAN008]|uniref:TetR/AcrR family transcriptional regulator C-terminal domain-containing protein n=1 Tax=Zavarzinia sp. CC-PAN008 TaxID=3243332 RepID=UPI003F747D85
MTYKKPMTRDAALASPRHRTARATRDAGRSKRQQILDAAERLFRDQGLAATTIADLAGAADAFPSQVNYYFGTKEGLFVEAACRAILHAAEQAERAAGQAADSRAYYRALVEVVMAAPALPFFVEALTLARHRPDLSPLIARTLDRLHAEGSRAYAATLARMGWHSRVGAGPDARRFWAIALGLAVQREALASPPQDTIATMLALLGADLRSQDPLP